MTEYVYILSDDASYGSIIAVFASEELAKEAVNTSEARIFMSKHEVKREPVKAIDEWYYVRLTNLKQFDNKPQDVIRHCKIMQWEVEEEEYIAHDLVAIDTHYSISKLRTMLNVSGEGRDLEMLKKDCLDEYNKAADKYGIPKKGKIDA